MEEPSLEDLNSVFNLEPKAMFSVASLSFQEFAEIDPNYRKQLDVPIGIKWYVKNKSGPHHTLTCTLGCIFPLITGGWKELREYYRFPDDVEVTFSYFGYDCFAIKNIKTLDCCAEIPYFHSRSVFPLKTTYFDVTMKGDMTMEDNLTIECSDFNEYLKENDWSALAACLDDGEVYDLKVRGRRSPYKIQLGYCWNHFCQCNDFYKGDILRFKFDSDVATWEKKCHVYKIGTDPDVK
ncbi:uncharacterized protein LOC123890810 [Trifolium pratense]|uniref:uncharacterized protein LOC123890810 n=1 Tax=Trifolium pratense TaxID=57577 RepID=UPI001E69774F|nr:uncharacterized protein LOC123890810 [Trifolium pratense]